MKGLTRLTNHLSMMSPASSLSAVCASLSSKISLTLSFTEKRSFLIAPPSVPNQFRICEGAPPVFPVPGMRQRNDALHALFFKFPIAVDIDFFQKIFLALSFPDKFIIKHFRARINTFFASAPHQRAGDLQGAFPQKNIPPRTGGIDPTYTGKIHSICLRSSSPLCAQIYAGGTSSTVTQPVLPSPLMRYTARA